MIKLRLSAFGNSEDTEIPIVDGISLDDAIIVATQDITSDDRKVVFQAFVNGTKIPVEIWPTTILRETDVVLICPNLQGSENNAAIFTYLVMIAAAPYLTPALLGGAFISGLAMAGVAVAASWVASQLFPPPKVTQDIQDESKTYSIGNQSNSTNKYGLVPKVYGKHRMFPNVAANPYTELETDPATGKLVEYLYGIYDLGLGQMVVEDIRLGETLLSEFTEVTYHLVDLNKGAYEGPWDDILQSTFKLYKGDVAYENAVVTLNGNQNEGAPSSEYQATRNAPENNTPAAQEIRLNFVAPQGFTGILSNGNRIEQRVEFEVHVSKANENIWKAYNDPTLSSKYSAVGGSTTTDQIALNHQGPGQYLSSYNKRELSRTASTLTYEEMENHGVNVSIIGPYIDLISSDSISTTVSDGFSGLEGFYTYITTTATDLLVNDLLEYNGSPFGTVTSIVQIFTGYRFPGTEENGFIDKGPYAISRYYFTAFGYVVIPLFTYKKTYTINKFTNVVSNVVLELISTSSLGAVKRNRLTPAKFIMSGNTTAPYYATLKFSPIVPGNYKIRITRIRQYNWWEQGQIEVAAPNTLAKVSLISIMSRTDSAPIKTKLRHTFLEIRIKATDQLNGTIQNLSAVCTSILPVYNGAAWVKAPTSNPAWIFADILTGQVNKRAISQSRLHTSSLVAWANFCDEIPVSSFFNYQQKRYQSNFVLDFSTTVTELLGLVANSCQASFSIIDGKYGVLIDKIVVNPVQIFTPKNSSGFQSTRIYGSRPHALKVQYIDSFGVWEKAETVIYSGAYNFNTATEFETLDTFGITVEEQAYRFGKFFLAQHELRKEVITIKVDFENLICTRGDYVQITQDSMKVGGVAARVLSIVGSTIKINEGIDTDPLLSYGIVFRKSTGAITQTTVTVVDSDEFTIDGIILPAVGDLVIVGEVGKIVFECIVKSITHEEGMSATLELVERAAAIYDLDNLLTLPDYDAQISRSATESDPPNEVLDLQVTTNTYRVLREGYEHYIGLAWKLPVGPAIELYEIYVSVEGALYDLIRTSRDTKFEYIVDHTNLGVEHSFKVLAVSATGAKLTLGEVGYVSATPLKKTARPSDILQFNSDITNEVIQLSWTKIIDLDVARYAIRYSPNTSGTWETSTLLLNAARDTDLASAQARTGIYLIKAVDFNGNESTNSAQIITTIPNLSGLNVVDTLLDFPTLLGSTERTVIVGEAILLQEEIPGLPGLETYYSEGYYYVSRFMDLTEIHTVRIQSSIEAEGYNSLSLMIYWDPLSEITSLNPAKSADWDVEAQYRATAVFPVMSSWATLSSILHLHEGSPENWTAWRKFIIGDAVGRIFQFRFKLSSYKSNITPRIFTATIKADMPDRDYIISNIVAPVEGYDAVYDPAFYGPAPSPNVQISIENSQTGDYYTFVSKTLEGFTIVFYDKNNIAVSRTFDAVARGWGRKSSFII